jgi:hypothetical protein
MTQGSEDTALAPQIVALYHGPLEEFVSRRDALIKQLRADKRRDDAAAVKAVRKPSRMAWVLDNVAVEEPASIDHLVSAIAAAQTAADLRAALETVREAVRAVAAVGARFAVRMGNPIEPNAIALAIHAIIGDASAFADLRAGRLVDVPEGGGLDLLSAFTPRAPAVDATSPEISRPAPEPPREDPRIALAAAARADLDRAEQSLRVARAELERATAELRDSEAHVERAEREVVRAQSELEARRQETELVRLKASSAAKAVDDARQAFENARAQTMRHS